MVVCHADAAKIIGDHQKIFADYEKTSFVNISGYKCMQYIIIFGCGFIVSIAPASSPDSLSNLDIQVLEDGVELRTRLAHAALTAALT